MKIGVCSICGEGVSGNDERDANGDHLICSIEELGGCYNERGDFLACGGCWNFECPFRQCLPEEMDEELYQNIKTKDTPSQAEGVYVKTVEKRRQEW